MLKPTGVSEKATLLFLLFQPGCYKVQSQEKVASLTSTVQELRQEIAGLRKTLSIMQSKDQALQQVAAEDAVAPNFAQRSYATAAAHSGGESISGGKVVGSPVCSNVHTSNSGRLQVPDLDKKFNVIIYGITECISFLPGS